MSLVSLMIVAQCLVSSAPASFYLDSTDGILVPYRKLLDQLGGRAQLSYLLRDLLDHINKLGGFSRGNPGEMESTWFYTHIFD